MVDFLWHLLNEDIYLKKDKKIYLFFLPLALFADFLAVDQAENIDTGAGIFEWVAVFNAGKSSLIFIEAAPLVTGFTGWAVFFDAVFWAVDDADGAVCCCCSRQIPRGWPTFVFDTLFAAGVSAGKASDEYIPLIGSFDHAPRCCEEFCAAEERSFKVGNSSIDGTAAATAGSCWTSSLKETNIV